MTKGLVLLGDKTSHGGKVISASSNITVDGKKAALVGDMVSCPVDGHGTNPIVEGSRTGHLTAALLSSMAVNVSAVVL